MPPEASVATSQTVLSPPEVVKRVVLRCVSVLPVIHKRYHAETCFTLFATHEQTCTCLCWRVQCVDLFYKIFPLLRPFPLPPSPSIFVPEIGMNGQEMGGLWGGD